MVSLDEAIKLAKEVRNNLDFVVEYSNGYVFSDSSDEGTIGGLNHTPVVIRKKDGKSISMIAFVNSGTGKEIKRQSL